LALSLCVILLLFRNSVWLRDQILCCVFVLFVFVMCTPCYQFLWIANFWLPLRYSLTVFSRPIILSEMGELSNIFSQITCLMELIHGKNILCMKHYKLLCFCGSEIQDSRNNRANILHNILRENEKYSFSFRRNHRRLSRTDHAPILSTDHSRVNSNKMICPHKIFFSNHIS